MQIDVVTVFPDMVRDAVAHSILKRAGDAGIVDIRVTDLRSFTTDRHRTTDDLPYGGGGGMVMKVEPIARALEYLIRQPAETSGGDEPYSMVADAVDGADIEAGIRSFAGRIILTDPRGAQFNQAAARRWANEKRLILLCGHYEGVDDRVRKHLITDEASIGDYVLTGGEIPALVIIDAVTRLLPGALGDADAPDKDTFSDGLLEYPHYTRPRDFSGWTVPEILLSGHHAAITKWRRWQQLQATAERRPDLMEAEPLSKEDSALLEAAEPVAPVDTSQRKGIDRTSNQDM